MKKLLLAFSLIAFFGFGITTASVTLPKNNDAIEKEDTNEESSNTKKNVSCEKSEITNDNNKSCCHKSANES